jgi:hypothetical protein
MRRKLFAFALFMLVATAASAHRLDEYLQGTIFSVARGRLNADLTLTPGVAVFPILIPDIDTNADGAISDAEQQAYAERVLADLSLNIDGVRLSPHLMSAEFPTIDEMKDGRGEIHMQFYADLPRGGASRKLLFENHHQNKISAYQVNVLVPRDPEIRIVSQNRNYSQSVYELDFEQSGVRANQPASSFIASIWGQFTTIVLAAFSVITLSRVLRKPEAGTVQTLASERLGRMPVSPSTE